MIKVGHDNIFDEKKQKTRKVSYSDIQYDGERWANASEFLPYDFDMVYLNVQGSKKNKPGWINGEKWDGLNIKPEDTILRWKRHE